MRRLIPLLLLLALPALAQAPHAMLTGTAWSAKRGVAGVSVTVTSPALQGSRTTTTVANGDYFFDALPPGTYDIQFAKHGFATVTHRGVLMLAQTARVDAELQPSQEEESITATGTTTTVLETPQIATTLDDNLIERLPIRRPLEERIRLSPGDSELFPFNPFLVDAAHLLAGRPLITYVEDSIDQTTILSGALTPEWGGSIGGSLVTITKSGGNDFTGSLRDTITSDVWHARSFFSRGARDRRLNHMFEGTFGGRIVPDRIWFFLSGGYFSVRSRYADSGLPIGPPAGIGPPELPSPAVSAVSREQAKITGAPTSASSIVASVLHASERTDIGFGTAAIRDHVGFDTGSIDATSMAGAHAFVEALAGESRIGFDRDSGHAFTSAQNSLVRAGWLAGSERFGSHELTAGAEHWRDPLLDRDAAGFVNDRWHLGTHWSFNIGARYDSVPRTTRLEPRLAVIFDVHGDGHSRWSFSHDRYLDPAIGPAVPVQEDTLAYAIQIGGNGFVRVDGWNRRWLSSNFTTGLRAHGVELQGSYRFLGLLEAGGNYTWMEKRYFFSPNLHDHANLWLLINAAVPHGSLSAALLEEYFATAGYFAYSAATTGIDVTWAVPIARATLFAKGDLMNAFNRRTAVPREFRLGLGARF